MKSISDNIIRIKQSLPSDVTLVAVSKTKPVEDIQAAYAVGQRVFGENKAQELADKYAMMPKDIRWHMIGHLQKNKVKYIAPFVALIHAVDSLELLEVINKEAEKNGRVIDCLLQFHIAQEESKFGLNYDEAAGLLESKDSAALRNVRLTGVMGMATYTEDLEQIHQEFASLREIFKKLKRKYFTAADSFKEISMGMSGDYPVAVEEGSTMVRIGSSIFGERNYNV